MLDELFHSSPQGLTRVTRTASWIAKLDDLTRHDEEEDVLNPQAVRARKLLMIVHDLDGCTYDVLSCVLL